MKSKWTDKTSRSQSDTTTEVRTTEICAERLRLVVTRLHGLDGWFMHLYGVDTKDEMLDATELESAQQEAVAGLKAKLRAILAALEG